MVQKEVTDLYEAAWLVAGGCRIEQVQCIPVAGALSCQFTFTGKYLDDLCERYVKKEAGVNVHAFRNAYGHINTLMHQAKRSYEKRRRESGREEL